MMQNSIIRHGWRLFALGLVLLLASCSLGRLGYNNADTIVYWWLNGYVDFDTGERPWVRQRIDALHAWHRHTQLKTYVPILVTAQRQLDHNVSKADVMAVYADIDKAIDRLVEQSAPDLADLAIAMSGDNMDALKKKFDATNRKFRKEYLDGDLEERQEHRYKMVMEWAEYWFGDFSDEQEAAIRRASDARPLNNEFWVEDRTRRQQALIALIDRIHREKLSRETAAVLIKNYIANNFLERKEASPEMQAFFAASKDGLAQLTVTIVNLTTPKQRAHAREKLQHWIDDFNVLAVQP
ncbi:MAG TPA: DUF6279 family lipoprotein [Burkholderiaceae bacterium]